MKPQFNEQPTVIEDNNKDKKKIICPRCGKVYWLRPGERITCLNSSNSPYASKGICFLTLEAPPLTDNNKSFNSK